MNTSFSFLKVMLEGRASLRFVLGVTFSFAFSIAVILCTLGLMDGYKATIKQALKKSVGDAVLYNGSNFITVDKKLKNIFKEKEITYSAYVRTNAFMLLENYSKGVVLIGVDKTYKDVTGLDLNIPRGSIVIGSELQDLSEAKPGESIVVTLATGSNELRSLTKTKEFKLQGAIDHGVFEKNSRFVYINRNELQELLSLGKKVNFIALKKFQSDEVDLVSKIEDMVLSLQEHLDSDTQVKPFWFELAPLLEAVEVEKASIGLILQIIVIISVFNIIAFVIFLYERKSKELFLFQALGLNKSGLVRNWSLLFFAIWFFSCALAFIFKEIFYWALLNLDLFELSGSVYGLTRIRLHVPLGAYVLTFGGALIWLVIISQIMFWRISKKSLISNLRQEFN